MTDGYPSNVKFNFFSFFLKFDLFYLIEKTVKPKDDVQEFSRLCCSLKP